MPRPLNPLCINCRERRSTRIRSRFTRLHAISRAVPPVFCSTVCAAEYGYKSLDGTPPAHLCTDGDGWKSGTLRDCRTCSGREDGERALLAKLKSKYERTEPEQEQE